MPLDYLEGISGVEVKLVEAKLKIIKMARMAKSWNGVDIIYEWNKYDAKIDMIRVIFASGIEQQLQENKVWTKGVRVVKVGSMEIIRYGPYVRKWS